jgi:protease PrsW
MSWDNLIVWGRGVGLIVGAGLFWLQYFDLKDHLNPEPRRMLVLSYFLGAAAAGVGLALYRLFEFLGVPDDPGNTPMEILLYCFLVVALIEEGVKFAAARVIVFRTIHFDEPIDGLVYSSAIAIGFASVESLIYTPLLSWPYQLARDVTAPLTHSLFSSIWGFGCAYAFFRSPSRIQKVSWQIFSVITAMAAHASYDFFLLSQNATYVASIIAFVMWCLLIWHARKIVHLRPIVH